MIEFGLEPAELAVDVVLLTGMAMTALAIACIADLFAAVMLSGIYSLLSACFFLLLDAADVAFTEAAVGAGISTLLMLSVLTVVGSREKPARHRAPLALLTVLLTGGLLIYGTLDMPLFGAAEAPVQAHVTPYYLEETGAQIGIPNVVTAVLASYRGFDTLGETVVIFTAGMGVLALLGGAASWAGQAPVPMARYAILRVVAKLLIPPIALYALYVQFHGDYGPGGGFQAGVIFAAAIFLYAMLFGLEAARRVVDYPLLRLLAASGVLLFGAVGLMGMATGGNFLAYEQLASDPIDGQHRGILLVELGVGITVATVMVIIFFTFVGRSDAAREQ